MTTFGISYIIFSDTTKAYQPSFYNVTVACKVIHVTTYKPSTYKRKLYTIKVTARKDKDRPARNKESGTRKERTAR